MKALISSMVCVLVAIAVSGLGQQSKEPAHGGKEMAEAIFKNYKDLKWDKILPDLGDKSPEICFLHIDPKTKATKLLIRMPAAGLSSTSPDSANASFAKSGTSA